MKTSYLEWNEYLRLLEELKGDKFRILIAMQGLLGLRVGDVLSLKWSDVVGKREVVIIEKKTKKTRVLYFSETLFDIVNEEFNGQHDDVYIFKTKFGNKPMSVVYVNKRLKSLFKSNDITYCYRVSSHLFRKTFGRRYMDLNGWSEKALIMLNKILRHSNIEITKIYLGINEQEVKEVYYSLV